MKARARVVRKWFMMRQSSEESVSTPQSGTWFAKTYVVSYWSSNQDQ